MNRVLGPPACVVLAGAVAGMLFVPVFGIAALLVPLGVLAVAVFVADAACSRRDGLVPWRPLVVAVAGLLAITETLLFPSTVAGLPTLDTVRALAAGVTESWQLTLQSTWPARADAELMLFVPLLVLLACVLGLELLHRVRSPLPALLPSLAVAVLSQLFATMPALPTALAALAYAALAAALLVLRAPETGAAQDPTVNRRFRLSSTLALAAPTVVVAVLGALVASLLPSTQPRYSVKHDQLPPIAETSVNSPLSEIGGRLSNPEPPLFSVRNATGVDRWPLVVLNEFDGVEWTPGSRYRRLGTGLRPDPRWTVESRQRSARIDLLGIEGPWLPSQTTPAGVRGAAPLVEEQQGTLLTPDGDPPSGYTLRWWEQQIDPTTLGSAAIDPDAPGGFGEVGTPPKGVAELAERAVGGLRPTFRTAVQLERFLRENYRVATGDRLPTGHAWPQLGAFLLRTKQGTSEQFAAAYVALARMRGIPSRLVVGFRAPAEGILDGSYTVHNGDVLAWPEIAVEGVGWVQLDPAGGAGASSGSTPVGGLAGATARVRESLPPAEELKDPPVAPQPKEREPADDAGLSLRVPLGVLVGVPAGLLVLWLLGVPAFAALRARRRRRRPGVGAVLGACEEVRDRLRAHGLRLAPGMTLRDVAVATGTIADQATVDGVRDLGVTTDWALYSGMPAPREQGGQRAWAAVRTVRKGLSRRGWRARLRAALGPRAVLGNQKSRPEQREPATSGG